MKRFAFTSERKRKAEDLLVLYPEKRSALLPLLWLVQEQEGWIVPESIAEVASLAGVSKAEVQEVASFYALFNRMPIGRHHIQVCTGVCCRLCGADEVLGHLKKKLGIDVGETTADGRFTLSTVGCLGSCGTSPAMRIGDEYFEALDEGKLNGLLASFK
ncbi:MAG TPA: NADH-quinone oxidoreductase subunit NuoE [bacterium]|nr:NADH-quinone oxidoreductase subunit NuoE [bacterium]